MKAIELNQKIPYATEDELEFLASLEVDNVVMLGAGPGVMLMAVLETNEGIPAYAIDHNETALDHTRIHLEQAGIKTSVVMIYDDSAAAAAMFPDDSVGLLIIDADHSYEAVKRDIEAWWPKLNGYVFFHDYDANGTFFDDAIRYPGVKQAVDEFFSNPHKIVVKVGTAMVIAK